MSQDNVGIVKRKVYRVVDPEGNESKEYRQLNHAKSHVLHTEYAKGAVIRVLHQLITEVVEREISVDEYLEGRE